MSALLDKYHHLRLEARNSVVNLRRFIERQAEVKKKSTPGLDLIDRGYIPNTPDWCRQMGTEPIYVADKPVDGRYLFNPDELVDGKPVN